MRERVWIHWAIYGLLFVVALTDAAKSSRSKFKIATTSTTTTSTTTTEEPDQDDNTDAEEEDSDIVTTTGHTLTGIPQIDYIWDPNLPRELNGYNLSSYPFYSTVPPDIDFKCDGLHDGFYASIPHKCQVYHHCLYGTRYDFLCANFTAFDQKTFICHFVSEVDCVNSKKFWHRNDALYQATTTTTSSTTTTTTTTTPAPITPAPLPPQRPGYNRRRRPFRRRPAYDYYDDAYYDEDYDRSRPRGYDRRDGYDYDDRPYRRDRDRDRERDRDYRDSDRDRNVRNRDRGTTYSSMDVYEDRYRDRDRDRETVVRDKFASRSNRRDPTRTRPIPGEENVRADEEVAPVRPYLRDRSRDSDLPISEPKTMNNRRKESRDPYERDEEGDDRRYSDKRYRPDRDRDTDYDDKPLPEVPSSTTPKGGYILPVAPSSSVYARPRVPPKIRRPVPLSEQDKYAYNVTVAVPSTTEPSRPRASIPVDDYLDDVEDDDLAAARPRRPMRRRPGAWAKDGYESREPVRDRERPYTRNRQRDDVDEEIVPPLGEVEEGGALRPRKRTDRPRNRGYDQRDRLYGYDRDRESTRDQDPPTTGRSRYPYRSDRPVVAGKQPVRDEPIPDRPRSVARDRDLPVAPPPRSDVPNKASPYRTPSEASSAYKLPTDPIESKARVPGKSEVVAFRPSDRSTVRNGPSPSRSEYKEAVEQEDDLDEEKPSGVTSVADDIPASRGRQKYHEEAPSSDYSPLASSEYYDDSEEHPPPSTSPRSSSLRIVKRPFLPSRGGNPNPRGLKPVGSKSGGQKYEEAPETKTKESDGASYDGIEEDDATAALESYESDSRRKPYDAYRSVKADAPQPRRYNEPVDNIGASNRDSPADMGEPETRGSFAIDENKNYEGYAPGNAEQTFLARANLDTPASIGSIGSIGQEIPRRAELVPDVARHNVNDVAHRLQDIPESEYDVTLNDALTPSLNTDPGIPTGFALPLHRNLARDASQQSSEPGTYQIAPPDSYPRRQQQQQTGTYQIATNDRVRSFPQSRRPVSFYSSENPRGGWQSVQQF